MLTCLSALRLVDNKAILYFDTPSTSDALNWFRGTLYAALPSESNANSYHVSYQLAYSGFKSVIYLFLLSASPVFVAHHRSHAHRGIVIQSFIAGIARSPRRRSLPASRHSFICIRHPPSSSVCFLPSILHYLFVCGYHSFALIFATLL